MTDQDLLIAYHHALDNLLALVHRQTDGSHAKLNALAALGEGARRFNLPVTVAFADDAAKSDPPHPRWWLRAPHEYEAPR